MPTVVSDAVRARELAREKYFAVALIDLDTPQTNAGLELTRWFKQNAPTTTTIVMCSRKVFESSVEAFRAGAADVIVKSPDQVQYLKQRTVDAAQGVQKSLADDKLIQEVLGVHEDFLRRLMDACRARPPSSRSSSAAARTRPPPTRSARCSSSRRTAGSPSSSRARCRCAAATRSSPRPPAARRSIAPRPHLPARARARHAARSARLDGGLDAQGAVARHADHPLFASAARGPGKAEVIEGSKTIPLVPEFSDGKQMVERIDELREAFRRKSRERRYLAAFRQENYELLKRYAELKQRLQRAAEIASARNTSTWPANAAGTSTVGSQTNGT